MSQDPQIFYEGHHFEMRLEDWLRYLEGDHAVPIREVTLEELKQMYPPREK